MRKIAFFWLAVAFASRPGRAVGPEVPTRKTVPCAPVLGCSVDASPDATCRVALVGPSCRDAVSVEVVWSTVSVVPATRSSDPDLVVVPWKSETRSLRPAAKTVETSGALKPGADHVVSASVRSAGGAVLGSGRLFLIPSASGYAVLPNHPVIEKTPIRVRQVRFEKRRGR